MIIEKGFLRLLKGSTTSQVKIEMVQVQGTKRVLEYKGESAMEFFCMGKLSKPPLSHHPFSQTWLLLTTPQFNCCEFQTSFSMQKLLWDWIIWHILWRKIIYNLMSVWWCFLRPLPALLPFPLSWYLLQIRALHVCCWICHTSLYFILLLSFFIVQGRDYTLNDRALNFGACSKKECLTVDIIDDDLIEDTETFTITLQPPSQDFTERIILSPNVTTVAIEDEHGLFPDLVF